MYVRTSLLLYPWVGCRVGVPFVGAIACKLVDSLEKKTKKTLGS